MELKKESDYVYINNSYGKTKNTIDIEVKAGIGKIKLKLK